jgi:hypothetical protein
VVHLSGDEYSWEMWTFPCAVMPSAPMVGEAAWAARRRWHSPLRGHVQWAHGVPGLHGGGRDDEASACL